MGRFISFIVCAGSIFTLWDNAIFWRYITIPLTLLALISWGVLAIYDAQENKDNESKDKVWYHSTSIISIWIDHLLYWEIRTVGFTLLVIGLFLEV